MKGGAATAVCNTTRQSKAWSLTLSAKKGICRPNGLFTASAGFTGLSSFKSLADKLLDESKFISFHALGPRKTHDLLVQLPIHKPAQMGLVLRALIWHDW